MWQHGSVLPCRGAVPRCSSTNSKKWLGTWTRACRLQFNFAQAPQACVFHVGFIAAAFGFRFSKQMHSKSRQEGGFALMAVGDGTFKALTLKVLCGWLAANFLRVTRVCMRNAILQQPSSQQQLSVGRCCVHSY